MHIYHNWRYLNIDLVMYKYMYIEFGSIIQIIAVATEVAVVILAVATEVAVYAILAVAKSHVEIWICLRVLS